MGSMVARRDLNFGFRSRFGLKLILSIRLKDLKKLIYLLAHRSSSLRNQDRSGSFK